MPPQQQPDLSPHRSTPAPARAAHRLLRLYAPVAMVIGLGSLAAICLTWYPFAMLVGLLPLPGTLRRRIGRGAIFAGTRLYTWILRSLCFVRLDLSALQQLRQERALVVVANHPSLLDAILFMSQLPNTVCVMKASLQQNILFGAATRLAHYVSNASPMQMVRQACDELRRDAHLVIFPEGTRTSQWPINPCSPASAIMAQRAPAPMQQVFIEMSTPYLGKGWPLFKPPVLPLVVTMRLGQRIEAPGEQVAADIARQFEQDMREHFAAPSSSSHV